MMAEPDDTTPLNALKRGRQGRRARLAGWPLALVLVWMALAVLDVLVIAPFGAAASHRLNASGPGASGGHRQTGPGGQTGRHHGKHHRTPSPSPRPSATPTVLDPVSAAAFGPDGVSSGDNASSAPQAIDASTSTAWETQWYATAEFGSLKTGTGLLIDMGRPVRITSVRILLTGETGAALKLYTGAEPVLADDRLQASGQDVGGDVRLTLARPAMARYLVVWFTLLPPESAGKYRVLVYNIRIKGTARARPPA